MTGRTDASWPWPPVLAVPIVVGLLLLVVPMAALVGQVEWASLGADIASPEALSALGLSLGTALLATAICLLLGAPLAIAIARAGDRTAAWLRAIVTIPLVLPPLVDGVALLALLGRDGPLGRVLAVWGVEVPFTTSAVVLAQTFVSLPFLVLAIEGTVRARGIALERTAASLGAPPWTVLLRVTLPLAAPGLLAGTTLCFARALGEFGATAIFAGNAPGVTRTMPLAIYTAFHGTGATQATAIALSLLLLVSAIAVLLLARAWRPGAMTGSVR
ncbi:molybdate ABC transporter permease subunit [Agrococcus sp. KRD186]|uniref:molybdate ABC transporter permease subunit n=1 Tax=Agrococcus sp. KRD186 TaxID=2729730 RepID=UPI0031451FEA